MRFFLLGLWLSSLVLPAFGSPLLVDDAEGSSTDNHFGGGWYSYSDPNSYSSPKPFVFSAGGYQSGHCARLEVELKSGVPYPYVGFGTSFPARDFSDYAGVRFYAKGEGSWNCQLPLTSTSTENNHFSSPFTPTQDWSLVELPFTTFAQTWGTPKTWDPRLLSGVGWNFLGQGGAKGFLCVDNIEFYQKNDARLKTKEANIVLASPKVNQVGYRPSDPKTFAVAEAPGGAQKGDSFKVMDEQGQAVYSGVIRQEAVDDVASTGEKVFRVEFSGLTLPGRYTVEIKGQKSPPFEVGPQVYRSLLKDALRCFYLIRCGVAIDDKVTGIQHPACHMKDATLKEDNSKTGDFTGGWHNADDYGKWILEDSLSCSWMMWLYELKTKEMADFKDDIPETGNGIPDLLNQARWALDWMLKMQGADGSVRHKVDAEDHFASGLSPEKDPYPRYAQTPGSLDAADFTSAMCQAARVFQKTDPTYAAKCALAAKKAWAWLEKNPDVVKKDPDYVDLDPSQEKLWALAEMARLTGDPKLIERFKKEGEISVLKYPSWMEPQFLGYMARYFDPKASGEEKDWIRKALIQHCDNLASASKANGYGVAMAPGDYYWECNEHLLGKTGALLFGYAATGDKAYRDAALGQMNWFLGENSLSFSFVTGHGENSVKHPWHWTMTALRRLMPGWASGGPNQYTTGADPLLTALIKRGTPPAKCYVDACDGNSSWASNEGETSENGALVFCSGFLAAGE